MATVARLLPHALFGAAQLPAGARRDQLVVVSDDALTDTELGALFPGLKRAVLVRDVGAEPSRPTVPRSNGSPVLKIDEVQWNPQLDAGFSESDRHALRRTGSTVVFLKPHAQTSGRMLRALHGSGMRRAIFDEHGRWRRVTIAQALIGKARWEPPTPATRPSLHRLGAALDRTLLRVVRTVAMEGGASVAEGIDEEAVLRFNASLRARKPTASGKQVQHIMHFVSSLDSGGAERQVVNMAIAQHERTLDTVVRTQTPLTGERTHYLPLLLEHHIDARQAGAIDHASLTWLTERIRSDEHLCRALRSIPSCIRSGVFDIYGELLLQKPDVLHCWLDEPNILGGVAGLLAGTPRIVLSTRNVNPTHFPHLCKPWMRQWYEFLAARTNVVLAGNSRAGVEDYSSWLGLDPSRFIILRNALAPEAFVMPSQTEIGAVRHEINVGPDQPLVVGIMRLSIEKRPDVFVETIRRLRLAHANCVAVIAGVGPLETAIRRRLDAIHLSDAVHLLGQRRDVKALLAAADIVLLTSDQEGTPNCLLEALALGKAVVATDAGGTSEVVEHEQTGLLADREDVGALSAAVSRMLQSPALRARYGASGRDFVRQRFGLEAVLQRTLATYVR